MWNPQHMYSKLNFFELQILYGISIVLIQDISYELRIVYELEPKAIPSVYPITTSIFYVFPWRYFEYIQTLTVAAVKMLNPVALFRSASSRSSSSRFLSNPSITKDEGYESSSDLSEESCMFSGSHQSTLDRLYAWEKKLYEEVRVPL